MQEVCQPLHARLRSPRSSAQSGRSLPHAVQSCSLKRHAAARALLSAPDRLTTCARAALKGVRGDSCCLQQDEWCGLGWLPLVDAYELRLVQHMALHGLEYLLLRGPRPQVQRAIQHREGKTIVMGSASRGTKPAIAKGAEVILSLGPPSSLPSAWDTPCGRCWRRAGRLKRTQWVKAPPGASGSSTSRANATVFDGTPLQESAGERFSPSQVKRAGIALPDAKAPLESSIWTHSFLIDV